MSCAELHEDLPDLLYGALEPERRAAAEAHLAGCAACAGLLRELEAVREGLPAPPPPPLLTARVKLAARDALLEARGPAPSSAAPAPDRWLLLLALGLAACLGVVGFGLGVGWERTRAAPPGGDATLPVPAAPGDADAPTPAWVEPEPPRRAPTPPRAPEAWQRVLFDAATGRLARGDAAGARSFFERARAVAPDGPLGAAAQVGEAEALLALGEVAAARALLEAARRDLLAGVATGGPGLLQRIAELDAQARGE